MKTLMISALALAFILPGTTAFATGGAHKPVPKLSMALARAIALKRAPGRIKDAEYEFENGGWRYSFDIAQGNRIHEIGVDAMTGRIVEDGFEAPGAKN